MKKATKILGIVALVLSIVSAVALFLTCLISSIGMFIGLGAAEDAGDVVGTVILAILLLVVSVLFIGIGILSIIVCNRFNKKVAVAKNSEEMKKIAIWEIVCGALGNTAGIVAGIFALVMNEGQYAVEDNIKTIDVDLEKHLKKQPKEEPKEEEK